WSEANAEHLSAKGIDGYLARGRMKHGESPPPPPRGRIPAKSSVAERMQRKLHTKAGRAVYARRKAIVEPVNGQIKQARGFRQFLRRGLERVGQEWSLARGRSPRCTNRRGLSPCGSGTGRGATHPS